MLIDVQESALLMIDVQDRLNPVMNDPEGCVENIARLMKGAAILHVPVLVSEQYPKGLGHTVGELASHVGAGAALEKVTFSCMADEAYGRQFGALNKSQAILCGIEAHVCVLQTAMDLVERGTRVFVVADATSSRSESSHLAALERIAQAGGQVVTTEMVLFEWLRRAATDEFKAISQLVK